MKKPVQMRSTILKKALDKASNGGWRLEPLMTAPLNEGAKTSLSRRWLKDGSYYKIIFSHNFARHFWGDKPMFLTPNGGKLPLWKQALSQMALWEDPIWFLEQFM